MSLTIHLSPADGRPAFTLHYDSETVWLPHVSCPLSQRQTVYRVLTESGCSRRQLDVIQLMFNRQLEGEICSEGYVNLFFPDEPEPSDPLEPPVVYSSDSDSGSE